MNKDDQHLSLELRNVIKKFPGIIAVDGVNLQVEQGMVFSLLGPSGCGKTTALRMIAGFEKPDSGDILINNIRVNDIAAHKRNCSMVFQTLALFSHMTVEENIAYGLERRRVAKSAIREKVKEMLKLVQLENLEKRRPAQLSGGQRQRVALARSLVLNPKILLLDEPLAALDRKLRKEMQVELKQIQRKVGTTFFYVTHDQKEALSLSDTIGVMNKGKLVQLGSPNEIYENPKTAFIADFLGGSNIFAGTVVASGNDKVQLEMKEGLRISAKWRGDLQKNHIAGISVHAELIEVLPAADLKGEENEFPGRVIEMIYQGDFIETKVVLEKLKQPVVANVSSGLGRKVQFVPGDQVTVRWNLESSNLLSG
jgi:spermidine/putrescine transport system ATP-binding protein